MRTLSVWKNMYEKALKLKPHDDGRRMAELFEEFKEFYLTNEEQMTFGAAAAFQQLGHKIEIEALA